MTTSRHGRRTDRGAARRGFRESLEPGRRRLRRSAPGPQRLDRPQAGADRPLPEHRRHRRRSPVRARRRARRLRARRRPQRRRARSRRRRGDDRPEPDERDLRRPGRAHRARAGRRALARAQPRDGGARARGDGRRDLDHRHRRADARRRPRLADGEVRAGCRQRDGDRARDGRRRRARRDGGIGPGPLLGAAGRRRQLRHRGLVPVPPPSAADGHRRADRASDRRGAGSASLLPRRARLCLRRPHGLRGAGARARRIGAEARGNGRLPHGRRPRRPSANSRRSRAGAHR